VSDRLLEQVRAGGLLPAGGEVVVLLSGGRDSVCLLDAAVRLAGRGHVRAVHVNYGLRPEAGEDEATCAALCRRLALPLTVEHAGGPAAVRGNLQAWAREVRYAAGARAIAGTPARLAVAHTRTDQAETIVYRFAASPGRRALLGMPDERGPLVRPLLRAGLTREDTAAWCAARGLPWREDASNASPRFARARVRTQVLPALRGLHPAAEANILRTAALLRDEAQVLESVVDAALGGREEIALEDLRALEPALARLVVRRLAEHAGGRACPRAAERLHDLLALERPGGAPAALDLGDGARAVVAAGRLRVERTPPRAPLRSPTP
jgi:tRNA(Ile)-lysidine synthase